VDLLWPIKWLIELILVSFHTVFSSIGFSFDSGGSWVLAIVGLVLVVRAALIPVFVRQIKSQRNMMMVQPQLAKLQKKYKGKTDKDSRERFAKEQMALYKETGSNPLSSCLPLILQMPIFISLFYVLNGAQRNEAGVGVAAIMIVLMSSSQFITQKQIMAKNQNPETQNSQFMRTQKIMLYTLPAVFLFSGLTFPLGVMTYWLVSNFWTMGQQFIVIRNMPTPGSPAHKARQERLERRGKLPKLETTPAIEEETPEPEVRQRNQPVSKNRSKKKKKK
jgi:YidC/Oxa1 family membrane protein insertase